MNVILEGGEIKVSQKTIEELASSKGINLLCQINEDGIKIDLQKEILGMDLPIHIFVPEIEIEGQVLKIRNFRVMVSSMPLPYISLIPFIKKYNFLALDPENKVLNINLKEFIPENISYEIEKICLKNEEIGILVKYITISLSNMVTE